MKGNKSLEDLAKKIRKARNNAGLSQMQLAKALKVSDKSISAYEQGRSVPPLGKLELIAQSTSHPIGYFTGQDDGEDEARGKLARIEKELEEIRKLLTK